MELLRSLIFVPGNRRDMLEKARTFDADVVMVDLEDSVPPAEKSKARALVREMGPSLCSRGQKLMVRLNSLDSGLARDELLAVAGSHLYGFSLGKVESAWDIKEADRIASEVESRAGLAENLKLIPWVESARAIISAYEIATASPRVVAIAFGADDYITDMGVRRTASGEEYSYARASCPVAARAAGIVALDTPYVDFRDAEGLEKDVEQAFNLGYKGKFAIHPGQLSAINQMFSPSPADLEFARRMIDVWEEAEAKGRGAVSLDGRMIDVPVAKRAKNLLALAEDIAARSREK